MNNSEVVHGTMNLKRLYNESVRVLKVTKKPDRLEFMTVVKVSGLGIGVIGLIGFIIIMISHMMGI